MSSDPADTSPSASKSQASVPFFCDFDKKTNAFWKRSNYALGHQVEISATPSEKSTIKAKVTDGVNVTSEVVAKFEGKNGHLEVTENTKTGFLSEFYIKNIFNQWNFKSKQSPREVEFTIDHRPEGSFWCTRLVGKYLPELDGERVCSSKASVVVQDSHYNLAVGGEVEIEDRRDGTKPTQYEKLLKHYSMGFLYSPSTDTQYSLLYSPDKESNGVEYDFTLFKQVEENLEVAGRAEGKADFRNTSPPVISLAASWLKNGNLLRGFVNSRREYGASYQVKVSQQVHLTLGLSSFIPPDGDDPHPALGFKLCLS